MSLAAHRLLVAVGVIAFGFHPASAATAEAGEYVISTGTDGGSCTVRNTETGGIASIACIDGENRAEYAAEHGCMDSDGSGACGTRSTATAAGSQLFCSKDRSYLLGMGGAASVACSWRKGRMTCRATYPIASATATCEEGCVKTEGAGSCCPAGAPGCGSTPAPVGEPAL